ncbi:hypothetical protein A165_02785 [Vibrio tasmaniensis ZS-17]|nr:hypothetical protein A6E08_01055 [Vibrio lentus]OED68615.1 hypothetical protein A165_02785 [Vibrio tasmaniensis ZS-17]PMI58016.1 hypothetical protein BCU41_04585 [Vibrio lentus]TKG16204.1 hypothetical protein FCW05_17300 [Vibrio lentus]
MSIKYGIKQDFKDLRNALRGRKGHYTIFRIGQAYQYESALFFAAEYANETVCKFNLSGRLTNYKETRSLFPSRYFA